MEPQPDEAEKCANCLEPAAGKKNKLHGIPLCCGCRNFYYRKSGKEDECTGQQDCRHCRFRKINGLFGAPNRNRKREGEPNAKRPKKGASASEGTGGTSSAAAEHSDDSDFGDPNFDLIQYVEKLPDFMLKIFQYGRIFKSNINGDDVKIFQIEKANFNKIELLSHFIFHGGPFVYGLEVLPAVILHANFLHNLIVKMYNSPYYDAMIPLTKFIFGKNSSQRIPYILDNLTAFSILKICCSEKDESMWIRVYQMQKKKDFYKILVTGKVEENEGTLVVSEFIHELCILHQNVKERPIMEANEIVLQKYKDSMPKQNQQEEQELMAKFESMKVEDLSVVVRYKAAEEDEEKEKE